jgi:hypothetical protein
MEILLTYKVHGKWKLEFVTVLGRREGFLISWNAGGD